MKIVIGDFVIVNSKGIGKFDLYKRTVLKSGARKGKVLETGDCWGIPMETCIKVIVQHRLDKKLKEINFTEFLKEYKDATEKLSIEIKEALKK